MVKMSKKNRERLGALINSIECFYIVMEGLNRRHKEGKITDAEYNEKYQDRINWYNRDVKELNDTFGLSIIQR
jgi:hypothetical protein